MATVPISTQIPLYNSTQLYTSYHSSKVRRICTLQWYPLRLPCQPVRSCSSISSSATSTIDSLQHCTYGNSPIALTLYIPSANVSILHAIYANLTINSFAFVLSVSYGTNTLFVPKICTSGFLNSVNTMKMLNTWSELPVIHMPIPCMGSCFAGARAISHAFFSLSVSISSGVGCLREGVWTALLFLSVPLRFGATAV